MEMTQLNTTDLQGEDTGGLPAQKWLRAISYALFAVGTLSRLAPLAEPHGRMLRQFMTEDGYLLQTVARNIGIGLGMSVSDGTIQTNGVQPLATFLFSICYFISGGNKVGGIAGVMLISVIVSLASASVLYALTKTIMKASPDGRTIASLVSALWFSSPLVLRHSMNGLETGLDFLTSLATVYVAVLVAGDGSARLGAKQMILLGVMLGLCFLARNDAAFLIAAVLLARMLILWRTFATSWFDRLVEATVPGMISVLIALPWLVYNYRLFGSIMPISGIAESLHAQFGQNLPLVPVKLADFLMIVFSIPHSLELKKFTIVASIVFVAAVLIWGGTFLCRQSRAGRYVLLTYAIFGLCLVSFYGLYFGAPYFMSRYLAVLSPVLALISVLAAYRLLALVSERFRSAAATAATAGCLAVELALNIYLYHIGMQHEHFQVVNWVDAHVSPDTWVGAVQSGTLGFFHDRTINLDGKVNPDALRAAIKDRTIIPYLLSTKVAYVADWSSFDGWAKITTDGFNGKFKLVVSDKAANLAVLKRVNDADR
jgi:hypothetical protein